jgi:hypothetical protein
VVSRLVELAAACRPDAHLRAVEKNLLSLAEQLWDARARPSDQQAKPMAVCLFPARFL